MADIATPSRPRRGLDYDDPFETVPLCGPLTRETAGRLADEGVSGVNVDASVPAADLVHLAEAPTIRRLDLSRRQDLVDRDLAFLAAMPWLTDVSLAHCRSIGDEGVAYLRGHQALERVNLQWSGAGDEAVAALAGKPSLHRVLLGNELTDRGVAHLRDFPALRAPLSDDSFLSISSSTHLTDDGLVPLGDLAGVVALDVHYSIFGSPHYTARGVAHLHRMTALEELNFKGSLTTDAVLREIAGIPRLRKLFCQDIVSGDEGFLALGACATLEHLGGRACHRVTDRGFAALRHLPDLRSLSLGGYHVTDEAMAALADAPSLMELTPIHFGDAAFAYIARMPALTALCNMYNRATTDAATRPLRDHPRLMFYGAFGTQITDESLRILATMPTLERIELENCWRITDAGLRELARLPNLRRISAWACNRVAGEWTRAMRSDVEAKSESSAGNQIDGYRFETLMDFPDMAIPDEVPAPPRGGATTAADAATAVGGLLARVRWIGCQGEVVAGEGLRLSVEPGTDTRWVGAITPDVFTPPLRIDVVVRPVGELHLYCGRLLGSIPYLPGLYLDDAGVPLRGSRYADPTPADAPPPIPPEHWTRVTVHVGVDEIALLVDDVVRHTQRGDFAGLPCRVAIGPHRSALSVRELTVEAPPTSA